MAQVNKFLNQSLVHCSIPKSFSAETQFHKFGLKIISDVPRTFLNGKLFRNSEFLLQSEGNQIWFMFKQEMTGLWCVPVKTSPDTGKVTSGLEKFHTSAPVVLVPQITLPAAATFNNPFQAPCLQCWIITYSLDDGERVGFPWMEGLVCSSTGNSWHKSIRYANPATVSAPLATGQQENTLGMQITAFIG